MKGEVQLGAFKSIQEYTPEISDFLIWHGFLRSWYGVVNGYSPASKIISAVFEGSPRLLLTQSQEQIDKNTIEFQLGTIRTPSFFKGAFYALQRTKEGALVWYI